MLTASRFVTDLSHWKQNNTFWRMAPHKPLLYAMNLSHKMNIYSPNIFFQTICLSKLFWLSQWWTSRKRETIKNILSANLFSQMAAIVTKTMSMRWCFETAWYGFIQLPKLKARRSLLLSTDSLPQFQTLSSCYKSLRQGWPTRGSLPSFTRVLLNYQKSH